MHKEALEVVKRDKVIVTSIALFLSFDMNFLHWNELLDLTAEITLLILLPRYD